ncbi:MAG TPA: hypothetical protein VHB48_15835 [Chitinophagaceae bacterium]|nr:hypothetical protein [Chitinophagaceae bacterium]
MWLSPGIYSTWQRSHRYAVRRGESASRGEWISNDEAQVRRCAAALSKYPNNAAPYVFALITEIFKSLIFNGKNYSYIVEFFPMLIKHRPTKCYVISNIFDNLVSSIIYFCIKFAVLLEKYNMQVAQNQPTSSAFSPEKMDSFFEEMIATLNADHLMLETNTATEEKRKFYSAVINKNELEAVSITRMTSSMYFVKRLLTGYLDEITNKGVKLNKLAFDLSDAKILVWAEVNEEDDETVNKLILAEAKMNAECSAYGFHISTTVVDTSDKMDIPLHYKKFDFSNSNWHPSTTI